MIIKLISLQAKGFKRLDLDKPLVFPEGSLLIYGRNESGKSTVMEAIHYALYGLSLKPSKRASVEDILNYGADVGFVHLRFSIDGDVYEVRRTIKRKGTNTHELRITRHDGEKEVITGFGNVNRAIVEALHGIDSDALLNSCMVEQKELGKLESSQKQERINTISTLLNLEAFTEAEDYLKKLEKEKNEELNGSLTRKGIREVAEEWKKRKEEFEDALEKKSRAEERLREIAEELPEVERRVSELEAKQKAVSKIKELSGKIERLNGELSRAIKDVEEAERLSKELEKLNEKIAFQERVLEAEEKLERIEELVESIEEDKKLLAREEPEVEQLRSKLKELKGLDKAVKEKEELVKRLKERKEQAVRNRMLGIGVAIGGSAIGMLLGFLLNPILFLIIAISIVAGGILVKRAKIKEIDKELESEERALNGLRVEELNLGEYKEKLNEKSDTIQSAKSRIQENSSVLFELVKELPNAPSRYRDEFNKAYSRSPLEAMKALVQSIHRDKEELTGMRTRRDTIEPVASDLKNRVKKVEDIKKKIQARKGEKVRIEQETRVTIEDEERLREEFKEISERAGELRREHEEKTKTIEECKVVIKENKDAPEKYEELCALRDSLEFELEAIKRAKKLLTSTRDAVFGSVKEKIESNMMKFLPLLTAGRYKAARIDEKEYKIQIYDKEARRWRIKGVFSGATQDQISLALRLAFALSTLPSSRGVIPGFIFLDEPLSGFDEERKKGLLELLTKGDIAGQFNQIIVISHGEQLRNEFPYKIRLEQGKVVYL
jgi:exonuclease SbcC